MSIKNPTTKTDMELNILERKIDAILVGNQEIRTQLALIEDRHTNTIETIKRYGTKLDSHSTRIRNLEENVRNNSEAKKAITRWVERFCGVAIMAYLGLSK